MFKKENIKQDFWKIFFPLLLIFYIFIAYNLVDVFFAGMIWEAAIAGLQIAFPIFFLILAFNEGLGTAMNNLASISLWENKEKKIAKYFTIWTLLAIFIWIIFFIFSEKIVNIFLYFSSDINNEVKKYAFDYWNILVKYSVFYIFWWMIWQLMIVFKKRKVQIFMASMILFLNIILDYIFVKYLSYWTQWIAYATVLTWIFTSSFGIYYVIFRKKITNFTKNITFKNTKKYLSFANSAFFIMILVMFSIMIDNYFFWKIWEEAIASYWIWTRLKDLLFYPIIAMSIAFSVLYWYYFWKKDEKTQDKLISWIIKISLIYWIFLLFLMPLIWKLFWWFFTNNELTLKYLFLYMIFSAISMFWFLFEFIFSSILQIRSHHKARILLNILFVILVFIFEYIFYEIFKSYIWVWIWALISALLVSYLTYLYYKIKIKKVWY